MLSDMNRTDLINLTLALMVIQLGFLIYLHSTSSPPSLDTPQFVETLTAADHTTISSTLAEVGPIIAESANAINQVISTNQELLPRLQQP